MTRGIRLAAVAAVAALLLAACSSGGGTSSANAGATASTVPTPTTDQQAGTDSSGQSVVQTASSDLGDILVGMDGKTLYAFTNDTSSSSTCYDACADNWPALTVDSAQFTVADSLDQSKFGTSQRKDGSLQVTIDGHPLYHFAGDQAAGDVNGQGIKNIWFVVAPDGTLVKNAPASTSGGGSSAY